MRRGASREGGFDTGDIFGRINPQRPVTGADDINSGALFEGAKLLELFNALERSWFPQNEPGKKIVTISIDADVPERWRGL